MSTTMTRRFLDCLQRNNPFYLISAACMLWGCLAVTNSLSWVSIPIGRLLALIITLNCYEALLIGLAVHLIRRGYARRDGVMLLVLEAFFLVDVTFLNAEIATAYPTLGMAINAALFAAALVKLAFIIKAAGGVIWDGRGAVVVMELAALFALPIVFRWIDHGSLTDREFYVAWWGLGLLIPLSEMLIRALPVDRTAAGGRMIAFYAVLPWVAIGGHLGILHYVYGTTYYGADAAPILLGLAMVMNRVSASRMVPKQELVALRVVLPAAAIFVSMNNPWLLCGSVGHISITPIRLASAGAYLTYVYCFFAPYAVYFLSVGVGVLLTMVYGPTPGQSFDMADVMFERCLDMVRRMVPTTADGWGKVAIGAAFAFLGIGARVSLRKPEEAPPV